MTSATCSRPHMRGRNPYNHHPHVLVKGIPVGVESDSDTFEEDSWRGVGQEGVW